MTHANPLIAIVDDEDAFASLYAAMLKAEGYKAVRIYDKKNVFDIMSAIQPDLIITGDGLDLLDEIRANPRVANIPVIVSTSRPDLMSKALLKGANYVIMKPFDIEQFLKMIAQVLNGVLRDE